MVAFRYSEWDGTQEIPPLDPDDVLEALTDDLMNFGDLQHAMRNLLQRGMRGQMGNRLQGLRDLLQQLRQQRRNTLDRFNLSSVMDDLKNRLDELLQMERDTIDRRLDEATGEQTNPDGQAQQPGDPSATSLPPSEASAGQQQQSSPSGQQSAPKQSAAQAARQAARQQAAAEQAAAAQAAGGDQSGGQQSGGEQSASGGENDQFAEMLKNIANRNKNFLSTLPADVGGAVKELQNYEFMDPEAQHKFTELMEMLKKAMTETFFKDMYNQIANMSPEDMARMKQMVKDLNQMLSDRLAGGEPDFEQFMQKYG